MGVCEVDLCAVKNTFAGNFTLSDYQIFKEFDRFFTESVIKYPKSAPAPPNFANSAIRKGQLMTPEHSLMNFDKQVR